MVVVVKDVVLASPRFPCHALTFPRWSVRGGTCDLRALDGPGISEIAVEEESGECEGE